MVFHPGFSAEDMGLPEGGPVMVTRLGRIFTYLLVPVAAWSDGTVP